MEEVYRKTSNSTRLPDYIENIASAKRTRHFDTLIKLPPKVNKRKQGKHVFNSLNQGGPTTYNAWEEDFATLNIFFGQETVMGGICLINILLTFLSQKSLREASRWDQLSSFPLWADSLASSLAVASSPSSSSSTGPPSEFVGILCGNEVLECSFKPKDTITENKVEFCEIFYLPKLMHTILVCNASLLLLKEYRVCVTRLKR